MRNICKALNHTVDVMLRLITEKNSERLADLKDTIQTLQKQLAEEKENKDPCQRLQLLLDLILVTTERSVKNQNWLILYPLTTTLLEIVEILHEPPQNEVPRETLSATPKTDPGPEPHA